ncbi:nuclear transcription factor Y subunit B-4-like [Olea europaea subsp. europaea]|uniref:Nuclear transcription factor Y subunit B-4-like n=1 Tax=Olea europaea subsp. europaea TaxID=158383 RepID=A0A8S0VKM7_OLEEU|nr:nuclear transcription factor Y subunit B-4-like [Olea europaea subsp. europaea]
MVEEQEKLPNVGRIMKYILPQNAKISKEAKETMQECEVMLRCLHKFREFERQKSEQNKASSSEEEDEVTSYGLGLQPDTFATLEFQILDKGETHLLIKVRDE